MVRTRQAIDLIEDYSLYSFLGFTRGQRIRSSLPFIIKPAINTSKTSSLGLRCALSSDLELDETKVALILGLCFLICGDETKKVLLPSNISCLDTLKALFVR